jgi:outer membrane protein
MRTLLAPILVLAALFGTAAQAQFSNRSVGLSLGYTKLSVADNIGIDHAIPLGLEYSTYIESGFELVGHFDFMILNQQPADVNVIGIAPSIGFHYLFAEEDIRPYVGADINFLHIFGSNSDTSNYFGVGPNVGVDFFTSESLSVGVRADYKLYIALNGPTENSFGGSLQVKTYF